MLRDIRKILDGQERQGKQDRFRVGVENSGRQQEFTDRKLSTLRVLSAYEKSDHAKRETYDLDRGM